MELEKTLESPLDSKEIQPVHPKGNQSWIFTERTDAEAETPVIWPLMRTMDSLERPWCWERLKAGGEGMTEDEMVGWHRWFNEHEFEQAPGVGEGQGSLACRSPWDHKESDTPEWLNLSEHNLECFFCSVLLTAEILSQFPPWLHLYSLLFQEEEFSVVTII